MNEEDYVSSGNIFADLDLPDPELRLAKTKAVVRMQGAMEARGMSVRRAAGAVGLDVPALRRLFLGGTEPYPLERLEAMADALAGAEQAAPITS